MSWHLSRKAEEDLIAVWLDGNERFGPRMADACQDGLAATFGLLADYPDLTRERGELGPPLRVHPTGCHLVLCEVRSGEPIFIVRIRHQREDRLKHSL